MSRLSDVRRGETAVVSSIEGLRSFRRRLLEMGLVPGTEVTVVNVAPLGDPLFIEVRGSRWSLRRDEAAEILVNDAVSNQQQPASSAS